MNDYIQHYGIKGMHWGIRRYQNEDGSLTSAGKKRYARELSKMHDEESVYKSIKSKSKYIDTKALKSARKALDDSLRVEDNWERSKEYKNAAKNAYDDTYEWFSKNDSAYLKSIIDNNGGKKTGLDRFHDFGKTYDGFLDIELDEARDSYNSRVGSSGDLEESMNRYLRECQRATDSLIGKYGNLSMRNFKPYSWGEYPKLDRVIKDSLDRYLRDK